jgi:Na+-translocating ferredoxin:NAD+ oxidoreductase RnfD subunit
MAQFRFFRPQNILVFFLLLLYIAAVASAQDLAYAGQSLSILAGIAGGYLAPFIYYKLRKIPSRMRWENAGITILILTLLSDQRIGIEWAIGLGLITALIKILFRFQGKPLLNPATAGLAVLGLAGAYETWWGVSFEPRFTEFYISIAALFTVPIAGYVAHKYNKLPISVALFLSFTAASLLFSGTIPWIILFEGTVLFYALVMATEPLTSPVIKKEQLAYGSLIGVLVALFLAQGWAFTYLAPLLAANVLFVLYRWYTQRQLLAKARAAQAQVFQKK